MISILMLFLPRLSLADEVTSAVPTDVVFILNSVLFLMMGFLVFWMAAGFTMLEAGWFVQKM